MVNLDIEAFDTAELKGEINNRLIDGDATIFIGDNYIKVVYFKYLFLHIAIITVNATLFGHFWKLTFKSLAKEIINEICGIHTTWSVKK